MFLACMCSNNRFSPVSRAGILAAVLALVLLAASCGSSTSGGVGASSTSVYALGPGTNSVLIFGENSAGALVPLASGPTAATGSIPVSMAIHSSGKLAFIANNGDAVVTILARNTGTGALSIPPLPPGVLNPPPPIFAGPNPVAMSITGSGGFLYVVGQGAGSAHATITPFSTDLTNNTIVQLKDGTTAHNPITYDLTATIPTFVPQFMTMSPDSRFLYVSSPTTGMIAAFAIAADGTLSAGAVANVGSAPAFMVVDPQLRFLYVTDPPTNSVRIFALTSGAIGTQVAGSPFVVGSNPSSIAVNNSANFLLVTNQGSNTVSGFTISSAGALTQVPGSPFTAGVNPSFVVFDKTNTFVYVADKGSNDIFAYALNGTTLHSLVGAPFGIGTSPTWISTVP
jgi:6-phosphogluconolactonase (cycloisomerase 2 family)